MTTFSDAFRSEVVRMARKELKPELQSMRKALTSHRSEIAALKREVKTLTTQLKAAQRVVKATAVPVEPEPAPARKGGRRWVFKPESLAAKRAELGISAKEMMTLLQASPASLNRWETGKSSPRAAQLERIHLVLGLGKRKALAMLAEGDGK
ncbi:helix-turn-helix domain-containing protein [Acidovorax sp.]|uniref:helix-turn-helix domain-containing protein n=1 Tax=Acidovorax sp. TaxID=1872122 RepID=UPI00391F0CE6